MEIKIGVQNVAREITVQTTASAAEVEKALQAALSTPNGVFRLAGESGTTILIPASAVAYLDLGQEHARQVGFGNLS